MGHKGYRFAWAELLAEGRLKRQRELSRELTATASKALPARLPSDQARAEFFDGQGTGAGEFLLPQLDPATKLDTAALRVCIRARLLLPFPCQSTASLADGPTTHCHKRAQSGKVCGSTIHGEQDKHAWWCSTGGAALHGHHNLRDWLGRWLLERTGSSASLADVTEQLVSQWDRTVRTRNSQGQMEDRLEEARLDNVFTDKSGLLTYVDVTFQTAGAGAAAVLARRAANAAAGLQDAVGAKLRRYPPDKHPTVGFVAFAVGALGRLSPEARGLLGSMARDSADTRRAYQAVSFLTQQRLADVLRASEPRLQ